MITSNQNKTHKFTTFLSPVTGLLVSLFTLIVPNIAHAAISDWLTPDFEEWFKSFAGAVLWGMSWIVELAAWVLDTVVQETVLNMAENVNSIGAISDIWVILRDFGNIIFIFILLYAAIAIILDVSRTNPKQLIASVFVVALLVNFSFFFSRVVVDASNVIALQFNNAVQVESPGGEVDSDTNSKLSTVFASAVKLPSIHDPSIIEESAVSADPEISSTKLSFIMLGGSIFLLVTAFVFLATAVLLLSRFAMLILLIILSPLAFIASITPVTRDYAKQWWDNLLEQALFAPAVFALFYIVGSIITSDGFQEMLASGDCSSSIACALADPSSGVDILLKFGLVTILMIATLIVAKQLGTYGAKRAISLGKGAASWFRGTAAGGAAWLGRTTAGRAGRWAADREGLKNWEKQGGVRGYIGQQARRAGEATASASFDVRNTNAVEDTSGAGYREGGFDEVKEEEKKIREERKKSIEELGQKEKVQAEKARKEKEELKEDIHDIDERISDIDSAIQKRNRIRNEISEARANGDQGALNRLSNEMSQLVENTDDIQSVNELDNIEQEKDRKENLKGVKEALVEQKERIINAGKRRGEQYVEAMSEQASLLDKGLEQAKKAANKARQKIQNKNVFSETESSVTTKTQGRQLFATENVEQIDNLGEPKSKRPKRRQRIIDNLS